MTSAEMLQAQLIESFQREAVNTMEEAQMFPGRVSHSF